MAKTLAELRAAAIKAFDDHQHDMKTDPVYRDAAEKFAQREDRKIKRRLRDMPSEG